MKLIKKILLPVDLLMPNKQIADYAMTIAETYGAEITVLYVVPFADEYAYHLSAPVATSQDMVDKAKQTMQEFIDAAFQDSASTIQKKIFEGYAADVIKDYADENDIDLIIMATKQRSGLEKVFLGSVTNRILRESPVPVLTLRPNE